MMGGVAEVYPPVGVIRTTEKDSDETAIVRWMLAALSVRGAGV